MDLLNIAKSWIMARWSERTTWDGGVIIGMSLAWIIFGGMIDWMAWVALAYGIFTFWKEESWKK
jgi:hypothetical protein|tara:strand:+ start:350 stop:541 length:192 start_codon:yes stop_codon:yes gene_type:complete